MNLPTEDQVQAVLRHVYTAMGTVVAVLMALGLKQGDATAVGELVQKIGDGIAAAFMLAGLLAPVYSSVRAWIASSRPNRLKAMDKDPEIEHVKTVPGTQAAAEAAAIPGSKVT